MQDENAVSALKKLESAEYNLSDAAYREMEITDLGVRLKRRRFVTYDDVRVWLKVMKEHLEQKAEASGYVPVFRESPPPNPRRANGQYRSPKDG